MLKVPPLSEESWVFGNLQREFFIESGAKQNFDQKSDLVAGEKRFSGIRFTLRPDSYGQMIRFFYLPTGSSLFVKQELILEAGSQWLGVFVILGGGKLEISRRVVMGVEASVRLGFYADVLAGGEIKVDDRVEVRGDGVKVNLRAGQRLIEGSSGTVRHLVESKESDQRGIVSEKIITYAVGEKAKSGMIAELDLKGDKLLAQHQTGQYYPEPSMLASLAGRGINTEESLKILRRGFWQQEVAKDWFVVAGVDSEANKGVSGGELVDWLCRD